MSSFFVKFQNFLLAVALACTELPLLLSEEVEKKISVPLYDTTVVHCEAAVAFCTKK